MTEPTLASSVYGFTMLLLGLALTAYVFSRMPRQRRQRIRIEQRRAHLLRIELAARSAKTTKFMLDSRSSRKRSSAGSSERSIEAVAAMVEPGRGAEAASMPTTAEVALTAQAFSADGVLPPTAKALAAY